MYRQPSPLSTARSFLPSPTPDGLSDFESESDLAAALERKRSDFDGEIEAFKAQKEVEFRLFEKELRSRKSRYSNPSTHNPSARKSELRPSQTNDPTIDNYLTRDKEKQGDAKNNALKRSPGPSKPSVSIDRVTINGLTTPPASGTPPLGRSFSLSPTNLSATSLQSLGKESSQSATISDKNDNLRGLFTPGFLQLLDPQSDSPRPVSDPPSTAHITSIVEEPTLPSTSLPSAIRNTSGIARKRKHVTFRLAHSVVVDPSSSYEESPCSSDDSNDQSLTGTEPDWPVEYPSVLLSAKEADLQPGLHPKSLKADLDEADFFSLDEDLADLGDEPPTYDDVGHP
ncbi:hypothetical protein HC762_01615 [bacterium]|nr:hypothetical protein [bacterium]